MIMPSGSLEQEALDRVARMYSSFDRRPRRPQPQAVEEPRHEQKPQPEPAALPESSAEKEKPSGLLDVLLRDKEQSLILLLLVILMKDGADMNTVLALFYILI